MNTKNNRRMQMSKKMIRDSLIELLETTSINQISVRSICENANVNRSTFYKYYSSQYNLLEEIENELLSALNYGVSRTDGNVNYIQLLEFISENKEIFRVLLGDNANTAFAQKINTLPAVTEILEQRLSKIKCSDTELQYLKKYLLAGGFELIRMWIMNGCKEAPEEAANIFLKIMK